MHAHAHIRARVRARVYMRIRVRAHAYALRTRVRARVHTYARPRPRPSRSPYGRPTACSQPFSFDTDGAVGVVRKRTPLTLLAYATNEMGVGDIVAHPFKVVLNPDFQNLRIGRLKTSILSRQICAYSQSLRFPYQFPIFDSFV